MWYHEIPVFITNHNRYRIGFLDLIDWLIKAGTKQIEIVDNASTYPPLVEYYKTCPFKVHRLENKGPYAFWNEGIPKTIPYVVTDADCVPDKDCPLDLIGKCDDVFNRHGGALKVGPAIRIDNIPDHYRLKQEVLRNETPSWNPQVLVPQGDAYKADTDTTFALYYSETWPDWHSHYRLNFPYVIEHRPWYEDSSNPSEEDLYFKANTVNGWSHWLI